MPHAETKDQTSGYQLPPDTYFVNDGPLRADRISCLQPSSPDLPVEELRRRYHEDGYLFLKGLLPRADVLKAREEYFKLLAPSGVLKPNTQPVEGIFDSEKEAQNYPGIGAGAVDANGKPGGKEAELFIDLALEAHTQDWYKEVFCKHPDLYAFISRFTGWGDDTLSLRRTLLRNNTPKNKAIGVHYDQIFLRHGDDTSITVWVPMGDIALRGGGLIYLEQGHKLGAEIEKNFTDNAKAAEMTDEEAKSAFNSNMLSGGLLSDGPAEFSEQHNRRWLLTEYEAGDVVLHTPYTIHASTINHDANNVIRLGTDLRFVDSSKPWDTRWSNDYRFGDGV